MSIKSLYRCRYRFTGTSTHQPPGASALESFSTPTHFDVGGPSISNGPRIPASAITLIKPQFLSKENTNPSNTAPPPSTTTYLPTYKASRQHFECPPLQEPPGLPRESADQHLLHTELSAALPPEWVSTMSQSKLASLLWQR